MMTVQSARLGGEGTLSVRRDTLRRARSVLATVAVVMASGVPYVNNALPPEVLWPSMLVLMAILSIGTAPIYGRRAMCVLGAFAVLTVWHLIVFGAVTGPASLGFFLMLVAAFLAAHIIDSIPERYFDVLSFLSAVSLLFFGLRQVGAIDAAQFAWFPGGSLENGWVHIGVFNFQKLEEAHRNSGPFWEPGAFAGYITIALLLSLFGRFKVAKWKVAALLLALVTTQSTTGYLASGILCLLWILNTGARRPSPVRVVATFGSAIAISGLLLLAYNQVPFLRAKIDGQMFGANVRADNYEITRYGSLLYDYEFITERPVAGWGASPFTRQLADREFGAIAEGQGNALTGFATKFGVPALLLYLISIYGFIQAHLRSHWKSAASVAVVCVLLVGEQFLNFPLFWCVAFAPRSPVMRGRLLSVDRSPSTKARA